MIHCAECGVWGEHECVGRDPRLVRFVDPEDEKEFRERQSFYADILRARLIYMRYGGTVDLTGICQRCGKPIDDHELTWARDWYPTKLCPHGKSEPTPIPPVFDTPDDDMQY